MPSISILFDRKHEVVAKAIATSFRDAGYEVFAGPKKLDGFDTLSTPSAYLQKRFSAQIVLMSLEFYHNHRSYFDQVASAAEASYAALQIASMDSRWSKIDSDSIRSLSRTSYFQEIRELDQEAASNELAERLVSKIVGGLDRCSHLNRTNFLNFIRSAYDPVEEVASVDLSPKWSRI